MFKSSVALCAAALASVTAASPAQAAYLTFTFGFSGTGDRLTQDRMHPDIITHQNLQGATLQFSVIVSDTDAGNGFGSDPYTDFSIYAFGSSLPFQFSPEPFQSSFYANGSGSACALKAGVALPTSTADLAQYCGNISYVSSSRAGYLDTFTGTLTSAAVSRTEDGGSSFTLVGYVPEPSTWALMLAGFGMVSYALRRRPKLSCAL